MRSLFRTKSVEEEMPQDNSLLRCLTAVDLVLLGIGAIIGAGVFVITGIAAATKAGPAICVSYVIAAAASMFAALAYAELAASVGGCGSAYNYAYVGFGELIAWIIGWNLILEYAMSVSAVAIGWSGYMNDALRALHVNISENLLKTPFEGGIVNLPAILIIVFIAGFLCVGVKQSARFNAVVVFIKLLTIGVFITVAAGNVQTHNWHPFLPFGWTGVMHGAALTFFAYIGFDALSTAAEETINPQRNLPIGILGSMLACAVIYIIVSALLTGIVPYTTLNVKSPVSDALLAIGYPLTAGFISAGAIAGLTTVILVMYYGLTRICYAISRDGLLPPFFAKTNPKTKTPIKIIVSSGIIIATVAGLVPLGQAAELVNIGTLAAFSLVCGGVIVLRRTHPNMPRPFKLPFDPLIPILGIVSCGYLMLNLPGVTWVRFVIWLLIGVAVYFYYGRNHSLLKDT
jgi:APA family basic amino acid/polyamine antiporter